jgi:cell division protein FtsI/penicillin-binding protein 2
VGTAVRSCRSASRRCSSSSGRSRCSACARTGRRCRSAPPAPTGPPRTRSPARSPRPGKAEDWAALQALTADPDLDAAAVHADAHRILRVEGTEVRLGTPLAAGSAEQRRAAVDAEVTWDLGELGTTRHTVTIPLVEQADGWRVRWWYPVVHPDLTPERRFERVRVFRDRAPILGEGDEVLVTTRPEVVVALDPERVGDPSAATDVLVARAGADRGRVEAVLAEGSRAEVVRLTVDDFEPLRDDLAAVAGVTARRVGARVPAVPGLEALLGSVGEVTAEGLEELGEPYHAGDLVGRSGIERAQERRLAGEPQLEARIVEGSSLITTLAFVDGVAPEPVRVTLSAEVQAAARAALDGQQQAAALVALDTTSGAVRAAASTPDGEFPRALEGRYPPGSTAKIVTAAAALADGATPDDVVDCPPVVRVGGRDLRNAGGDGPGAITLTEAMARSCNTAFASLAESLGSDPLLEAAGWFGFDTDYAVGLPAFGGRFPEPADAAERALAAIGQGRVEASPVHMASVVAAAATGTWYPPHVVAGTDLPAPRTVPGEVTEGLRTLLRAVVADGTGGAADLPGEPVLGKTGSAEFGTGPELATHAWFVAVRGDLAVAVVVEGGGGGGAVAAPVAARFLEALAR